MEPHKYQSHSTCSLMATSHWEYPYSPMKVPGNYKQANRQRAFEVSTEPALEGHRRIQRIVDSLRAEITAQAGVFQLRIRQVFQNPKEVYRLELEVPELGYQRTTLLERDVLEELLAEDEVRERIQSPMPFASSNR